MAKIFLIRHAESLANATGIYQGQSYDTSLSNLGQKQARALGERFAGVKFDAVFSSPLKRTGETASVLGVPLFVKDILETNHGDWEGRSKTEIASLWPSLYKTWLKNPDQVCFPGGEKFSDTASRAISWFADLCRKHGTYAVVTHTNIIQVIITFLRGESLNSMWKYSSQPTAVTFIEANPLAKIVYLNDTSHLRGLESNLNTHAL